MAQMPKGEPRSVPDPVGDQYNEMIRQEKFKKQPAEAATAKALATSAAEYFSPFKDPFAFVREAQAKEAALRVKGRDAPSVYVDPKTPPVSPAELAERRRAIDRAFFMANNPLAGTAYGLAALTNASPEARETALIVGGLFDAATVGAASRGAPLRGPPGPPPRRPAPTNLQMPAIRPRELNAQGQARGVNATNSAPMLGTGTRANQRLTPPGWRGGEFNEGRAHLHPKDRGGSGDDSRNIFTATQNPTNSSHMTKFDNRVKRRVREGELIESSATPFYTPGILPPSWILQTAYGPLGGPIAQLVRNPAGFRR